MGQRSAEVVAVSDHSFAVGADAVRVQCPHWALAAAAPCQYRRPWFTLVACSALRSTNVFWPGFPPRVAWFAIAWTPPGQAASMACATDSNRPQLL